MESGIWNIVQAEFFLVGKGARTLDDLVADCVNRFKSESRIKIVVRFSDEGGFVTSAVAEYSKTNRRYYAIIESLESMSMWKRWFADIYLQLLINRVVRFQKRSIALAVMSLEAIAATSRKIAVELPDRSFRPLEDNELHELLESVRRATGAWLFVFEPNNLLRDKQRRIASAM